MFVYILILFVCMLLAYRAEITQKKIYVCLVALFLVFIGGFRGEEVGIDTPNYIEIWDRLLIGGIAYQEVGFQFIITSLQHITDNPTYMFLACSSIIYPLIIFRLWDFRKVASFTFMIAMFFLLYYLHSFNVMRQYIALAIVFYFSRYLQKGNYFLFFIGVLLSVLFHTSSLLALAFFGAELLLWKYLSKWQKWFIALCVCFSFILIPLVLLYVERYFLYFDNTEVKVGSLVVLKLACLIITYLLVFKKNQVEYRVKYLVKSAFILAFLGVSMEALGYFFPYMSRIGLYMTIFQVVYYGILMHKSTIKANKIVFYFVLFVLYFIPFLLSAEGFGVLPYEFTKQFSL